MIPTQSVKKTIPRGASRSISTNGKPKLFDTAIFGDPQAAMDFITNVLESSTEYAVVAKDLGGKILLWNEGARRLYGYEPAEAIGKNSSILHIRKNLDAGLPEKIMAEALQHGKYEGTVSRRRKNSDEFPARLVVTLRRDPSGNPVGFLLISKDISDDIRMSQYARSLIEASLDPLVTISVQGKITDVNEATATLTGVSRDKLIGTNFSNYFTEQEKAQEAYRQGFAKGMVTNYPLTIRHVNGRLTDVLYNASVYRDEHGNVLGVFAAARDVTAQKQAEAQVVDQRAQELERIADTARKQAFALVADERAKELERLAELERFQKLTLGRELRMIELKKEIEDLKKKAA